MNPTQADAIGVEPQSLRVLNPGSLPSNALVRDRAGNLYITTYGRFHFLVGQPFTPGERPEMIFEVQVLLTVDPAREEGNPLVRQGPLFYTGHIYDGNWRDAEVYRQRLKANPRGLL